MSSLGRCRRKLIVALPSQTIKPLHRGIPQVLSHTESSVLGLRRLYNQNVKAGKGCGQASNASKKVVERDFFYSVLNASTTKREAKSYLSRFQKPVKTETQPPSPISLEVRSSDFPARHDDVLVKTGVNLGSFYSPARAIERSPVFAQQPATWDHIPNHGDQMHISIFLIRSPQFLDDATLDGVGLTLTQLARLGVHIVVILDLEETVGGSNLRRFSQARKTAADRQAERIATVIRKYNPAGARRVDEVLAFSALPAEESARARLRGSVRVQSCDLLLTPMKRGAIPILSTVAFGTETQQMVRVASDEVVIALIRELAGIEHGDKDALGKVHVHRETQRSQPQQDSTLVERLIILEPTGGIPSFKKADGSHLFINLQQEYGAIRRELHSWMPEPERTGSKRKAEAMNASTETSDMVQGAYLNSALKEPFEISYEDSRSVKADPAIRGLRNLDLVQSALALLPPSSSALITTAAEAAKSARPSPASNAAPEVRTRAYKNPLIHNLLTDKPIVSPSLPAQRLPVSTRKNAEKCTTNPATFCKLGMPLTMYPDPNLEPWVFRTDKGSVSLTKPPIDLSRLVHLIEDSFSRPLDVQHYLGRIRDCIAGVIVVGEYEGGSLFTWEYPPSVGTTDVEELAPSREPVPYLDKFAVQKRSQGSGGVADVMFTAMVRTCFPQGVVWRSRANNPVNKWYFERAVGSWKLPGTQWTMFWTTEGVEEDKVKWKDYVDVCASVQPSWADKKDVAD